MEKKFDPLAWAAASNNNAATGNGQSQSAHVINPQSNTETYLRSTDDVDSKAELMAVIDELIARRINICESYHDWLRVGFALAYELGPGGCDAYHQLSAMSTKYNQAECEAKWQECLRSNSGRVTKSTIFWLAQQEGVDTASL